MLPSARSADSASVVARLLAYDRNVGLASRRVLAGIVVCFFLSGATGLVYQVLWLRMLGLVFGHTVYAITTVLARSWPASRWAASSSRGASPRQRTRSRRTACSRSASASTARSCPSCWPARRGSTSALHGALRLSYDAFSLRPVPALLALLLLPDDAHGRHAADPEPGPRAPGGRRSAAGGALYAVNTFGAVVGVVLAGYVLLPALGNRPTLAIAAATNIAVGG